jgi:FkbM family methyltransferase
LSSPSIRHFLDSCRKRMQLVKYGDNFLSKLHILVFGLLNSYPRTLRGKVFQKVVSRFGASFKGKVVSVEGTRYVLVDDESFQIVLPESELWMWDYLRPKEGDIFLDVGAHIGKYALQVAKITGENGLVIAVEPMPDNHQALERNIKLNSLQNLLLLKIAAWKEQGKLRLFVGDKHGRNTVKRNTSLGFINVEAEALDKVLEELGVNQVDCIKIDVEGAEYEVLQGLTKTLMKGNPRIVAEVWNRNERDVSCLMKRLDFDAIAVTDSKNEDFCYYCYERKDNEVQSRRSRFIRA